MTGLGKILSNILGKKIMLLGVGLVATVLLSACTIELELVETRTLQQYTISGLPQLDYSNLAASITVDDVLEFSINGQVLQTFVSDRTQQIPPFTFSAYPDDEITLRAKNLNSWTGCGIGDVYLLTSNKSYKLSDAELNIICYNNEVFYNSNYQLSTY